MLGFGRWALKVAWDIIDFVVTTWLGGWSAFGSVIISIASAAWALFLQWGPISIGIGLFTLWGGLLALPAMGNKWVELRGKKHVAVKRTKNLRGLMKEGSLLTLRQNYTKAKLVDWHERVKSELTDESLDMFQEFEYANGIENCLEKLDVIIKEHAKKHRLTAKDVL